MSLSEDEKISITQQAVDKLDETMAAYFFPSEDEDKYAEELGSLMSAAIFTFFIRGIQKMNAGVKRTFPQGSYLEFIKDRVVTSLDKMIEDAKNAKKD